jgi:hypothetical protein
MPPAMPCPSVELLRRYVDPDDPMPEPERQRIAAHVECCDQGCKQAFSPDRQRLACVGRGELKVWDARPED